MGVIMSKSKFVRRVVIAALGAMALTAVAPSAGALARRIPSPGGVRVDVAPLAANAGEPTADWVAEHPDEARKLVAQILKKRGEDPGGAVYWPGYGLPQHALYKDHDTKFWLDVLVREGKLKPGQLSPEDVATNKFNSEAELAPH